MGKISELKKINEPTNGAKQTIEFHQPYAVEFSLQGSSDLLFHRWNCESIEEKAKTSKGSKAKRTDDVESYVFRNEAGEICIPSEYVRQSIIHAAKFKQDPRSPRKTAMDLFKAAIVPVTNLASLGTKNWDYEHKGRVTIQRQGINRVRPAMKIGWVAEFQFEVILPEYVQPELFQEVLNMAGRVIGIADYRPTYGRFFVSKFSVSGL